MQKKFIIIFALFLLLPIYVKAETIKCKYDYQPSSTFDAEIIVFFDNEENNYGDIFYTINKNDLYYQVKINLENSDFVNKNANELSCPIVYINHKVENNVNKINILRVDGTEPPGTLTVVPQTLNDSFDTPCADFANTIKIGGLLLLLIKIFLPLIIIIKSSLRLFSVIAKGDSSDMRKKMENLGISLIAAILIFFTPTIVNSIFGIVTNIRGIDDMNGDIEICKACLFEPLSNKCTAKK